MADRIDYPTLVHDAMRGLVARVLRGVAETGLPGRITSSSPSTPAIPGVELAGWLRAKYPGEMTIVLQHWFDDLIVMQDAFQVTLNFGNRPETVTVPFEAISTFVDPSVEFGLRFDRDPTDAAEDDTEDAPEAAFAEAEAAAEAPQQDAEIVSLDKFRK
ncbi:MAG: hypothetical protein JKP98_10820 [Rhodobacteraceae bacterium]|nr:hypothetical protein [Paracoccaceae bacterium]